MVREYKTVRDAAELWVSQFDAVPQGMIDRLMQVDPDEWQEVTKPCEGDTVYVYDVPEELGTREHRGNLKSYNERTEHWCIELYDGKMVFAVEDNFEVEYDEKLPMWGTMWQFSDSCDNGWLEEGEGIEVMSCCGFRIYEHEEFGYWFGIDGAGYNFYDAHWIPLYRERGLHWHDKEEE